MRRNLLDQPLSLPGYTHLTGMPLGATLPVDPPPPPDTGATTFLSAGGVRPDLDRIIAEEAARSGVSPHLIRAVIGTESSFDPTAESSKGALGLMQLMPATAQSLGVTDPTDPAQNVRAGAQYLREQLDRYPDNEALALAAYNAGPTRVAQYGHQVPPFQETTDFIRRVQSAREAAEQDAVRAGRQPLEDTVERTGTLFKTPGDSTTGQGGLRIRFTGAPPTPEEVQEIWAAVDPEGVITREDLPMIGGGVGSAATSFRQVPGTSWRNRLARDAARTLFKIKRLPIKVGGTASAVVTGLAGGGAELLRQGLMPQQVGRFTIEGSPRESFLGTTIEGNPRSTPEWTDDLWAAGVRGAEQLLGEKFGQWLGGLVFRLPGRLLQRTAVGPSTALQRQYKKQDIMKLSEEMSEGYIKRGAPGFVGVGPTAASAQKVDELIALSSNLSDEIVAPYAAQGLDFMKVIQGLEQRLMTKAHLREQMGQEEFADRVYQTIQRSFESLGADPATGRAISAGRGSVLLLGGETGALAMKRLADADAAKSFVRGADISVGPDPIAQEIARAWASALRDGIIDALPPEAGARWAQQNLRTQGALALRGAIEQGRSSSSLRGAGAGVLAGGLGGTLGAGGSLYTGSAWPLLAAAPVVGAFHSPTRSVAGRLASVAGRMPLFQTGGRAAHIGSTYRTDPMVSDEPPLTGPTIANAMRLVTERPDIPVPDWLREIQAEVRARQRESAGRGLGAPVMSRQP